MSYKSVIKLQKFRNFCSRLSMVMNRNLWKYCAGFWACENSEDLIFFLYFLHLSQKKSFFYSTFPAYHYILLLLNRYCVCVALLSSERHTKTKLLLGFLQVAQHRWFISQRKTTCSVYFYFYSWKDFLDVVSEWSVARNIFDFVAWPINLFAKRFEV